MTTTITSFDDMSDAEFLEIFEDCRFPLSQWRHKPHVVLAYLYLRKHTLDACIPVLRAAIQKHNASHDIVGGYHETLTQVWTRLIHATMQAHGPGTDARAFFDRHTYLLNKMLPLLFYSHARIMSQEARQRYLQPDLTPMPDVVRVPRDIEYEPDPGYMPIPADPRDVLRDTSRAIERGENLVSNHLKRGAAHGTLKHIAEARSDFETVLTLESNNMWAHYHLGALAALEGHAERAASHLQKAAANGFKWLDGIAQRDPRWAAVQEHEAVRAVLTSA